MKHYPAIIVFLTLALFSIPSSAAIQLIAEPGQPADDFSSEFIYWGIDTGSSAIGASGQVAFSGAADISIDSTDNKTNAVWAGLPGQLKAIIRENESPEGFPDNVLFDSAAPAANVGKIVVTSSGYIGFPALLKGAVQGQRSLLAHVNGTTFGVIREGDPAPGFSAGTFVKGIANFSFSDAGMVIIGQVAGSSTPATFAIWFYDFQTIKLLPSPIAGCTPFLFSRTSINDISEIAFSSSMIGSDNEECSVLSGLFKWKNGNWETLQAEEDSVPGMSDAIFSFIASSFPLLTPMINDQGDVAISAVSKNTATLAQKGGLWVKDSSNDPKLLVLDEETLKGNPNDIIAKLPIAFFNSGFTNDGFSLVPINITAGTTALLTGIPRNTQPYSSLNDTGESQLAVVAQQNDQPPGFDSTWFYSWFLGQALNRTGQFVFTGRAKNATGNEERTVVWRGKGDERPRLKAMEGMKVTVNGEERVLEQIFGLSSNRRNTTGKTFMTTGGNNARFSDNGHFVFDGKLSGSHNGILLLPDDSKEQRIFELAEQLFPQFFSPANVDDRLFEGFEYRFYPDKNTYLGIKNGDVFLLGDAFGSGVKRFDTVENTLRILENLI